MVEIAALRALRYAPQYAAQLAELVAPPYDVIEQPELQRLWARGEHNVVRLILPAGDLPPDRRDEGYGLAAARLRDWKRNGILTPDPEPSLYLYRQRFRLPGGEERTRQGFFALARLTPWGEAIHRHELTLPGPVADRVRLLDACRANLSAIFGLYSDPTREVLAPLLAQVESAPTSEALDDRGVWHGLWRVSEPETIARVAELIRARAVVVADGHHRYTAALEYRNRRRRAGVTDGNAPCEYVLFYFAALEDPGLLILPTHQALHGLGLTAERFAAALGERFALQEEPSPEALQERMAAHAADPSLVLGAMVRGRCYLLRAPRPHTASPEEALDVSLLRRWAVEPLLEAHGAADLERHLRYTHDAPTAAGWVREGEADVAFFLRPTPLEQVRTIALAGRTMPQKSTYFYPKLLSGLLFYDHAQHAGQGSPRPAESCASMPQER